MKTFLLELQAIRDHLMIIHSLTRKIQKHIKNSVDNYNKSTFLIFSALDIRRGCENDRPGQ